MMRLIGVLLLALAATAQSPTDPDYQRGMSFARLGLWDEAREAFATGHRKAPRDKRFPLELAGVAFKQDNFPLAKAHLLQALSLDPADAYANDFLATVYLLEGNLEAALTYWNRVGLPRVRSVRFDPPIQLNPVLQDRALSLVPGAVLRLEDLEAARARLESLEVLSRIRFDLETRAEERPDLVLRAAERKTAWLAMLAGLPYQTVYPAFYNLGRSGMNLVSLIRWDAQKRRAFVQWSAPLGSSAAWRYRLFADLRNENWQLTTSAPDHFNLRKAEAGAEISALVGDRWTWSSGAIFSRRDFRNTLVSGLPSGALFADGALLKYRGTMRAWLWRVPERRFTVASAAVLQNGRLQRGASSFTRTEGSLDAQWFPQARGDDYAMRARVRSGKTWGELPFDELVQLSLERDNDLAMRAHIGTRDGRKGSAPLGRDYFLLNWEQDKIVYRNSLLAVKLGPFLDSGRIFHPMAGLAPARWMWDAGVQCKVSVLGAAVVVFTFGKDLRTGNNAFYAGRPNI